MVPLSIREALVKEKKVTLAEQRFIRRCFQSAGIWNSASTIANVMHSTPNSAAKIAVEIK